MANTLNSVGSIATFLYDVLDGLTPGISGNLVIMADTARQHVANFVGEDIGSNNIAPRFQSAIVDFAKADTIDLSNAGAGGGRIKLGDLSIDTTSDALTSKQYRMLGESKLNALGRSIGFAKSLS